jgi:hypothetical protein
MSTGTDPVDRALVFLAARQQASGGFEVRVALDLRAEEGVADPSLFATATIARALGACESRSQASPILARALTYLRGAMEPGGVWRHWTREHPEYAGLPADSDDTACVSSVLRRHGVDMPDNVGLLLANRDGRGLFRTWLVPRWPPPVDAGFWRVAARRARRPLQARRFWATSAGPGDVDGVVNANVLSHIGDGPHAAAVVDYLISIVRRGEEEDCDKWYRSAFVFHAALARCVRAGVSGLEIGRDEAVAKLLAGVGEDGATGAGAVDAALAVQALGDWGAGAAERRRVCEHLARTQEADGSWPAEPFYFGGPRHHPAVPEWGSRELTTGLCLEALARATTGSVSD